MVNKSSMGAPLEKRLKNTALLYWREDRAKNVFEAIF